MRHTDRDRGGETDRQRQSEQIDRQRERYKDIGRVKWTEIERGSDR